MRTRLVSDLGLVAITVETHWHEHLECRWPWFSCRTLRNIVMRTWRVGDLGLVATHLRNFGMRTWRVEFALSVTLV